MNKVLSSSSSENNSSDLKRTNFLQSVPFSAVGTNLSFNVKCENTCSSESNKASKEIN